MALDTGPKHRTSPCPGDVEVSWENALTDFAACTREATVDEHRGNPSPQRRLAS